MYLTEEDLQAITYVVRTEIKTGLVPLEERLDRVEERLDRVEERLDRVEERLDGMDERLDGMDERLSNLEESNEEIRSATNYLLEIHDGGGKYIKLVNRVFK